MKSIVEIRNSIFDKYGVVIPYVRVIDNQKLLPFEYVIKVSNNEVARYTLKKDSILIIDTGCVTTTMKGISTKEPAFGVSAFWISSAKEDEAKENSYVVASYKRWICHNVISAQIFMKVICKSVCSFFTKVTWNTTNCKLVSYCSSFLTIN